MNLFCLGLSHHTAAVSLRECFAVGDDQSTRVMRELREAAQLDEIVLLSTCNRVEVYAMSKDAAAAMEDVAAVLQRRAGRRADFVRLAGQDAVTELLAQRVTPRSARPAPVRA